MVGLINSNNFGPFFTTTTRGLILSEKINQYCYNASSWLITNSNFVTELIDMTTRIYPSILDDGVNAQAYWGLDSSIGTNDHTPFIRDIHYARL